MLGHRIIACCRMAGFDALRNMYRPLSVGDRRRIFQSLLLLLQRAVGHIFLPAGVFEARSRQPKVRLALAIFAAACLGNSFFHFTRELLFIHDVGLWTALRSFQAFFFYSVGACNRADRFAIAQTKSSSGGILSRHAMPRRFRLLVLLPAQHLRGDRSSFSADRRPAFSGTSIFHRLRVALWSRTNRSG